MILYIPEVINICSKIVLHITHYKNNVDFYTKTVHNILAKEILRMLAKLNN